MTVGEKIRELRQARGLTQKELASSLGCVQQVICYWEIGKFEPSLFYCILLADVFGISLDELACRDFKGVK